VDIALV